MAQLKVNNPNLKPQEGPKNHVNVLKPTQSIIGFDLSVVKDAVPPSKFGPGHLPSDREKTEPMPQPSCGQANDNPIHDAALGGNEPLSVADSVSRPPAKTR